MYIGTLKLKAILTPGSSLSKTLAGDGEVGEASIPHSGFFLPRKMPFNWKSRRPINFKSTLRSILQF